MKKFAYILLLPIFFACNDKVEEDHFEYAFSITKAFYFSGSFVDSTIFYYNNNNQLLKSVNCFYSQSKESMAVYQDSLIMYNNRTFYLDSLGRVYKKEEMNGGRTIYEYENGLIFHIKSYYEDILNDEYYYNYDQSIPYTDSAIFYDNANKLITVYQNKYSDLSLPFFVSDFRNVLVELPVFYDLQLEEKRLLYETVDDRYIYSYEVEENIVIEYIDFYEDVVDSITCRNVMKYYLGFPE